MTIVASITTTITKCISCSAASGITTISIWIAIGLSLHFVPQMRRYVPVDAARALQVQTSKLEIIRRVNYMIKIYMYGVIVMTTNTIKEDEML